MPPTISGTCVGVSGLVVPIELVFIKWPYANEVAEGVWKEQNLKMTLLVAVKC